MLLVEDNEINRELASQLLRDAGITVSLAENGREAVEKVTNESFDGVLMDVQMPEMDGYQAARVDPCPTRARGASHYRDDCECHGRRPRQGPCSRHE